MVGFYRNVTSSNKILCAEVHYGNDVVVRPNCLAFESSEEILQP